MSLPMAFLTVSCANSIALGIAKPLDFLLPLEPNTAIFLFKYVFNGKVIISFSSVSPKYYSISFIDS